MSVNIIIVVMFICVDCCNDSCERLQRSHGCVACEHLCVGAVVYGACQVLLSCARL